MKIKFALVPAALLIMTLEGNSETTAKVSVNGKWVERPVRTIDSMRPIAPVADDLLTIYGGYKGSWQSEATGFFRTEFRDKRWWFIDPLGYPFISIGMNTVTLAIGKATDEDASSEDEDARFEIESEAFELGLEEQKGDNESIADETLSLLRKYGFNTLGRWSQKDQLNKAEVRMPYMTTLGFMAIYRNKRKASFGKRGYVNQTIPVFDEGFVTFADDYVKTRVARLKDDPWLLGHYTDNELPIRPNALKLYLSLPESDRGHQEAVRWLAERKRSPKRYSKEDNDEFVEHVAFTYYSVVTKALKKYDPNHLVVGSRQHGRTMTKALLKGSSPLDVVSLNYYHSWSPSQNSMTGWVNRSGRPFIQSEWYAKKVDDAKGGGRGAGYRVASQLDRGLFYQNHTLGLIDHPGAIGWHWFKYKGVLDNDFQPISEMLDKMEELNKRVYPILLPTKGRVSRLIPVAPKEAPAPPKPATPDQNTFEGWQAIHFNESEQRNPKISGPNVSASADNIPNLFKYALFLDPKQAIEPWQLPRIKRSKGKSQLKYIERIMAEDLAYDVEISEDGEEWQSGGANVLEIYRHSNQPEMDDVTVEFIPTDDMPRAYMRLNIKQK